MSKCIGGIAHDAASSLRRTSRVKALVTCLRRRRRSWNLFKQVLLVPCHRRLSYAGCDGYEVAFANPENNKTGLLDNNLSKKHIENNQYGQGYKKIRKNL